MKIPERMHRFKVPEGVPDSTAQAFLDLEEMIHQEIRLTREYMNRFLTLGHPDFASLEGSPNGVMDNIKLSWAQVELDLPGERNIATTVIHNLDVPTGVGVDGKGTATVFSALNVRWWPVSWRHRSGTGLAATNHFDVAYVEGDNFDSDSIQLRFFTDVTIADTDEVIVDLLFIPAAP